MGEEFDFAGWATRFNIKCSDGRTIRKDAFKSNDGQIVPLVWNHQHNEPDNVLGHALLEYRDEGMYAYGKFNDTESGKNAKLLVMHGDVNSLSIYANQLKQQGGDVYHGNIRELSLVLAGANPGALIESVICHGEDNDEEAIIYNDEESLYLSHTKDNNCESKKDKEEKKGGNLKMADQANNEKTLAEVFDTLTEEQKTVVYALIGQALEDQKNNKEEEEGNEEMKHNVFDNETNDENVLSHSEMQAIFSDAKRYGSLKDSVLAHGIDQIDYLFPDATHLNKTPEFISREMG